MTTQSLITQARAALVPKGSGDRNPEPDEYAPRKREESLAKW